MTAAKQLSPWTFVPTCPSPAILPPPTPPICAGTTGLLSAELPFLLFRVSSPWVCMCVSVCV